MSQKELQEEIDEDMVSIRFVGYCIICFGVSWLISFIVLVILFG